MKHPVEQISVVYWRVSWRHLLLERKAMTNLVSERVSEVAQSCPTLWDPMDCSIPGSSVHGIFQARVLEWVAISFSRGSSRPRDRTRVSHIAGRCFYCLSHQGSLTNLDSVLKIRNINLLKKVHIVKAMVFPEVLYECARGGHGNTL